MKIAFIGLGNMGGGMAANLVKAGHHVRAFDLSEDALARAKEAGCETFTNVRDAGTLTFMVGGEIHAFEAAKPVLEAMGKAVIHAGGIGNGQAAKICNNMLLAIHMIGTCEAFAMAEKLGLDAQTFYDISSVSSGQNWSMTSYCPVPGVGPQSPSDNDYQGGFATALMLKDLKLAMEAAESAGATTALGRHAKEIYEAFAEQNGGLDFSGVIKTL
jgi:3-hydroxyisobutyrate dehydrogenase